MLVELHVVDLGIVADLDLVLGTGLTAITGETGAGKTLLVEAVELLVGGRADPSLVRDGAAEARVEGRFVDRDGTETVLTRVIPRDGRSRAYIDGRLATAGELAELRCRPRRSPRAARAPVVARSRGRSAPRSIGSRAPTHSTRSTPTASRDVRSRGSTTRWPRSVATHAPRAREIDLLRFQVDEIVAAELDRSRRGRGARSRRGPARRRSRASRRAGAARIPRSKALRSTRSVPPRPSSTGGHRSRR